MVGNDARRPARRGEMGDRQGCDRKGSSRRDGAILWRLFDPRRAKFYARHLPVRRRSGGSQQSGEASRRDARLVDLARSEEHTSELQSLMRISYAVFCLKKKKQNQTTMLR